MSSDLIQGQGQGHKTVEVKKLSFSQYPSLLPFTLGAFERLLTIKLRHSSWICCGWILKYLFQFLCRMTLIYATQ